MAFLPEEDVEVQNEFLGIYSDEPEYRSDKSAHNYSKLKDFIKDPLLVWKKKYITGDYEFKTTEQMDLGSLVDCKQFEPHLVDEKFCISSAPTPSEGSLKFVNALIGLIEASESKTLEDNMLQEAYTLAGIKTPLFENYINNKFLGTDVEVYFAEKLAGLGKTTLGLPEFEAAERCVKMLNESPSTREIFRVKGEEIITDPNSGEITSHIEGIAQLGLKARIEGHLVRVLLDWVTVNHSTKEVSPYDLKTIGTGVEDFPFSFFKMKYYIQQGNYEAVVKEWVNATYPGYKINPFQFIVVDSSGFVQPLVYKILAPEGQSFLRTFRVRDREYISGLDIIELINYHTQNDLWTISKRNRESGGKVTIQLT